MILHIFVDIIVICKALLTVSPCEIFIFIYVYPYFPFLRFS
jgi:hypothetical protein